MVQSLNKKVDLTINATSYLGMANYGKVLVGDEAFEYYNDKNVNDYIQIPWSEERENVNKSDHDKELNEVKKHEVKNTFDLIGNMGNDQRFGAILALAAVIPVLWIWQDAVPPSS